MNGTPRATAHATANVCQAASCLAIGSEQVLEALAERVTEAGLDDVAVKRVGCLGLCAAGPLVQVTPSGELFERVSPDDADEVVGALRDVTPAATPAPGRAPFFARQVRVVTENSGRIDPESLDDYVAAGGYEALRSALTSMTPAEVIDEVTRSGLRGRGGAGYPTGLKWRTVAKATAERKYVICNGDEGDPGAFMDRSVLESDPHRVLEGMAIAGYAVGATQGYIYVPRRVPAGGHAPEHRHPAGQAGRALLGAQTWPTPLQLPRRDPHRRRRLRLRRGDGADRLDRGQARDTPRPRPPYPAEAGLWGRPTLINNVETFANIAADHPQRRRLVRRHRHREEQGHQGLRAGRPSGQHRADRGADGHHAARDRLRDRRRHPGRPHRSRRSRPAGRPAAASPPQLPRHAGRLRVADAGRLDHGLGRHDRDGRHLLHGRRRALLHGVLPRRVVRQVHPLPGRHRPAARAADPDQRGRRHPADLAQLEQLCGHGQAHQPVRPRPVGARTRCSARCATSATSTWPTSQDRSAARPGRLPTGRERPPRRRSAMSVHDPHASTASDVAGAARPDDPGGRARERHRHPDPLPPRRPHDVGACRLCLVEVEGVGQAAAGLRDRASRRAWR